jgi:hypothetical protein
MRKDLNSDGLEIVNTVNSEIGSIRHTMSNYLSRTSNESRAFRFKKYLIENLEEILSKRPHVIEELARIKIVDAVFAFKNSELTKMLVKRGKLIT